jgi:hypothetical protein
MAAVADRVAGATRDGGETTEELLDELLDELLLLLLLLLSGAL